MAKQRNPLDETFDIEGVDMDDIDPEAEIIIPEIKNLDTIIDFALRNYKELLENVEMMDLKTQLKARELARDFLREAKDAIDKREKLRVAWERLEKGSKSASKASSGDEEVKDTQGQGQGISRSELAAQAQKERMRRVK